MEECIDFLVIDCYPAWSPDGQWIVYVHLGSIYLIHPDGTENTLWYEGAGWPVWSPDGLWIAFRQNGYIWKMKLNGDSLTQLTFEGCNYYPTWSHDGNLITYLQSGCNKIPGGLWSVDLINDTCEHIMRYGIFPEFHPQLKQILYKSTWPTKESVVSGDSILIFDYNTMQKKCITVIKEPLFDNRYFRYNHSGTKIIFTSQSNTKGDSHPHIWIMNADGSECRKLIERGYSSAWSPDGLQIVYTDNRKENGRLWIFDLIDGNKRQLTFDYQF
jgi:Tol biopolymer transport system component